MTPQEPIERLLHATELGTSAAPQQTSEAAADTRKRAPRTHTVLVPAAAAPPACDEAVKNVSVAGGFRRCAPPSPHRPSPGPCSSPAPVSPPPHRPHAARALPMPPVSNPLRRRPPPASVGCRRGAGGKLISTFRKSTSPASRHHKRRPSPRREQAAQDCSDNRCGRANTAAPPRTSPSAPAAAGNAAGAPSPAPNEHRHGAYPPRSEPRTSHREQ